MFLEFGFFVWMKKRECNYANKADGSNLGSHLQRVKDKCLNRQL